MRICGKMKPGASGETEEVHEAPGFLARRGERGAVLPGDEARAEREEANDLHLRSANKVTGYHIEATDGDIGHVEDFIIDGETWEIRYMVVDTQNW